MDEHEFLSRIAYMYYKEDMDLKSIGTAYSTSYATISRALKRARELGIVTIQINNPVSRMLKLESKLKERLNIKGIISVNVSSISSYDEVNIRVAQEAAGFLTKVLKNGDKLGISWGSTVYRLINNYYNLGGLNIGSNLDVDVVQLNGNFSSIPIEFNSSDLVRRMKNLFKGSYYFINSEAYVDSPEMKEMLMISSSIKKTFDMHKSVNIAVLGIGAFDKNNVSNLYRDYINPDEIKELGDKDAVGENCLTFFDYDGNIIEASIYKRTITIGISDLLNIKNKIIIATGKEKAKAIIGATKSKMVDTLFTDSGTLQEIYENVF